MSVFGWDDVRLKFGNTSDLWYDIKSYIDEQSALKLTAILEDWFPKGNTWKEKKSTGLKEWGGDLELKGLYDNTATSGPDILFNNSGARLGGTGKVAESFDAGASWRVVSVINAGYVPEPKQGGLTRFTVTLTPYGSPYFTATEVTGTV